MIKLPRVGPRPVPRSFRRRLAFGVLSVAVLAFVILELWSYWVLGTEIDALESRGESVRLEKFLAPLQEGQSNASDVLNAACALVRLAPDGADGLPVPESLRLDQAPPQLDASLIAVLAVPEYRMALETLDLAGDLEYARYLRSSAERPGLSALQQRHASDRFSAIRLARLLHLRAYSRVAAGQHEQAYQDILGLFRMSRWTHEELPVLFSWLLARRFAELGLGAWEQLATLALPSPSLLIELEESLADLDLIAESGGLSGERAFMFQLVRRSGELIVPPDDYMGAFPGIQLLFGRWTLRAHAAEYLRGYGALIAWSRNPPYLRGKWTAHYKASPLFGIPVEMILPNLADSVTKNDRLRARIDLARIAVARSAFIAAHGEVPGSLQALIPDHLPVLPIDPWSGQPFTFFEDEDGCRWTSTDPGERHEPITWRVPCLAKVG